MLVQLNAYPFLDHLEVSVVAMDTRPDGSHSWDRLVHVACALPDSARPDDASDIAWWALQAAQDALLKTERAGGRPF